MLLKLFLSLVPFLLLTDGGNPAGGDGGGNEGGAPNEGGETPPNGDQGGGTPPRTQEPSANKLIKDFAKDRGLTVEALLDKFSQMEDAGRTETERLTKDRDGWKSRYEQTATKLRDMAARSAVAEAAREAGATEPALIYRAVRGDLEFDDDGTPINIDAVLADLKTSAPSVFRASGGSGDGGRGNGQGGEQMSVSDAFRELARNAR